MEDDHLKSGLSEKTNCSRPFIAKSLAQDLQGTLLLKGSLSGNTKLTSNEAALYVGIHTADNSNKILAKMTKYVF